MGSALAILLLLVVYWEKADEAGEGIGLLLASFPGLVNHDDGLKERCIAMRYFDFWASKSMIDFFQCLIFISSELTSVLGIPCY